MCKNLASDSCETRGYLSRQFWVAKQLAKADSQRRIMESIPPLPMDVDEHETPHTWFPLEYFCAALLSLARRRNSLPMSKCALRSSSARFSSRSTRAEKIAR